MLSIAKNEALTLGYMALHVMAGSGVFPENVDIRKLILELEREIATLPQVALTVRDIFSPGIYAREIYIPALTIMTGAIHKGDHLSIVSQGSMLVLTEDGVASYIKAPYTFVAKHGTKRIGYALEDTVWTTMHATTETNVAKILSAITVDNFEALGGDVCQ